MYRDMIHAHLFGYILQRLFAQVRVFQRQFTAKRVSRSLRQTNTTWLSQRLQPRSNIHPITVKIIALDDDITEIDSEPKFYALLFR